jgi:internalin A
VADRNSRTGTRDRKAQGAFAEACALIEKARKHGARKLDLTHMGLSELPESIGQLTALETLYLGVNRLSDLPNSIGQLTDLRELHLHTNKFSVLPGSFSQLTALETLNLCDNKLTELPESIGQLTALRSLGLDDNQLTELPGSLRRLKLLTGLYLHGNEALGLPAEVLGRTWSEQSIERGHLARPVDILDYYFRIRAGHRPLNEAKLILVGRGGAGKTSLVNRLVEKKFFSKEKKTEGIKITEWPLELRDDEKARLNVWDFGGQEIMHATHQFFLTQRSLYLVVINGREGGEDADAEYWLKLIDSFGGNSPVIVVLNKIKEHPFDLNRGALRQKYPNIGEFIKTDCKDATGCANLRKTIERETDRLEHLRDPFPAAWFAIKDKLAGTKKKNYVSFDEYRKLCAKLGETDQNAQEALAGYLTSLGIALNYKDDPRLRDTHVLNPHWVTRGIYKILNSALLEKQKGEIRLGDLPEILSGRQYPPSMHRFLLDLMKKFELCFNFPEDDSHFLIPELLDKQQPTEAEKFKPENCLNFEYRYPVLPEGLLPRFIVRSHGLSEGTTRWRTGSILKFEGSEALVKADAEEKRVSINVRGGDSQSRRRLLAVIRSDFERIHRDIKNLNPVEMVPLPDFPSAPIDYRKLSVMEENGVTTFPEVIANRVIEVNVRDLLGGVDLEGARQKSTTAGVASRGMIRSEDKKPVQAFISYSHKDEKLRLELETHLKLLQRTGVLATWNDRKIDAGDDWKNKIDESLERADIILLLVSRNFFASDYCYDIEMNRALKRHDKGDAIVLPIIVRDVNWKRAPFARIQGLPAGGRPVMKWKDRDSAWRNVSEGIEVVVKKFRR